MKKVNLQQFTQGGRFLMLALDQRGSFRKILSPTNPQSVSDEVIIQVKSEIIEVLQNQFSGILLDPQWGLPAFRSFDFAQDKKPFLLCIEKSGFEEQEGERITELANSVSQLKNMGASGIKLNLNFNPFSPHADLQIGMVKKVAGDCKVEQLPFFLEIVTYPFENHSNKSDLVIKSAEVFLEKKIIPDVFKLEYPGDANSCKKVTQMLGKIPWILLTLGIPFEIFKKHLEIACFNGASGFLAGRSIWQAVGKYKDHSERKKFLQEVTVNRFREISRIVKKYAYLT